LGSGPTNPNEQNPANLAAKLAAEPNRQEPQRKRSLNIAEKSATCQRRQALAYKSLLSKENGGAGGIRTLDRVAPIHAFQACSLNHSDTAPQNPAGARLVRCPGWNGAGIEESVAPGKRLRFPREGFSAVPLAFPDACAFFRHRNGYDLSDKKTPAIHAGKGA
jgi:hypothetical protein